MVRLRQDSFGPGPVAVSSTISSTASMSAPSLPLSIRPLSTTDSGATSVPSSDGATLTVPASTDSDVSSSSDSESATSGTMSITILPTGRVPTPTQSPGTPGSSPSWTFLQTGNATTCQPYQIRWTVPNSTSTDLSNNHLHLFVTGLGLTTPIANQSIVDGTYTWPAVTVPQGNYTLAGIETDGSDRVDQSAEFSFSVLNGSNTNCLSSTGSAGGAQNVTVLGAAKSGTNAGAIAGGTVGGVIALVCACIAAFFLCTARRRARAKRFIERRKHWSGVNSVDSKVPFSRGSLQGEGIDHLDPQGVSVLRAVGRAHVNSSSSLVGEKVLNDPTDRGHELPELTRQGSWSSTNIFETDSTGHGLPRPLELAHLSGRPSAPASPRTSSELHDPFAPTPTATNRRASRTPRKPVPAYEPTTEELEALAIERTRSDRSHARTSVNPSPSSYSPAAYSHQHSSSLSAASAHGEALLHGLKSKSSGNFDDQPVHYLIPDMPSAPPED